MTIATATDQQNKHTYDRLYVSLLDGLGTLQLLVAACGAEQLDAEAQEKLWGYLQWTREGLRQFAILIVLWLPERLLSEIAKKAPDFWSWRSGVFHFHPEEANQEIKVFLEPATFAYRSADANHNRLFSIAQLEDSLTKGIALWGKDNPKVVALYAQLGEAYAERVKEGKFIDREQEMTRAIELLNQAIGLQIQEPKAFAVSLNNLANLYKSQGQYSKAELLYI